MPKTKKVAKWRKSLKALKRVKIKKTRFVTKLAVPYGVKGNGTTKNLRIRIYDNKVKKFIKGEWEFSHALPVLGHLLENPNSAKKFGYAK